MTRTERRPLVAVKVARLRAVSSILSDFKSHMWELELECGHVVDRRIRWLPQKGKRRKRGWSAMHNAPSLDRLPPEPKHARCDECPPMEDDLG